MRRRHVPQTQTAKVQQQQQEVMPPWNLNCGWGVVVADLWVTGIRKRLVVCQSDKHNFVIDIDTYIYIYIYIYISFYL